MKCSNCKQKGHNKRSCKNNFKYDIKVKPVKEDMPTLMPTEMPEGVDKSIIKTIVEHFQHKYPKIFSNSKSGRCNRPHIHFNGFQEALARLLLSLTVDGGSGFIIERIEEFNSHIFSNKELVQKYEFFKFVTDAKSKGGFYLGIIPSYGWLDIIFGCITPTVKRLPIPNVIRNKVWVASNGESWYGKCHVCEETIAITGFHCGHDVAVSKGGETTVENMKPICSACNLSMGTKTMSEKRILQELGVDMYINCDEIVVADEEEARSLFNKVNDTRILPEMPTLMPTLPPMDKSDRVKRLKEHLTLSKVKHEDQVMKLATLKEAHTYCVINGVSAQQYGPLLERFIRTKFNYIKNKAEDCTGDCSKDGKNSEVKVSLGGATHTKFNFVQIRPSHDCETYILTAYHLSPENVEAEGELYVFKVPKKDIKKIVLSYGGYAHGTIKEHGAITIDYLDDEKSTKEYSLRPTINDDCWKELMAFRVLESAL